MGVCVLVKRVLKKCVVGVSRQSHRCMSVLLKGQRNDYRIFSIHCRTEEKMRYIKERVYDGINELLCGMTQRRIINLVMGGFNAEPGKGDGNEGLLTGVVGDFGRGSSNENTELMLNMCHQWDMAIADTHFMCDGGTWMHPAHQSMRCIDHCVVPKNQLKYVTNAYIDKTCVVSDTYTGNYHVPVCMEYRIWMTKEELQPSRKNIKESGEEKYKKVNAEYRKKPEVGARMEEIVTESNAYDVNTIKSKASGYC